MTSPRIDEKSVFNVARRIESAGARAAYLREVCGADPQALRHVEDLLETFEHERGFLESPAVVIESPPTREEPLERPGARIGPYQLVEQIGEGGFGVVYRAEQSDPIRREIALKVLKPGMDTREVVARFDVERQALALMDHPNIAKVLDGGETPFGRPYFVMDLVKGLPITQYCDDNQLTPRQRLELFLPVCQAVQHAHQKGIIHRDLKPSNVLVASSDGHAVPKVIDFGVAKATWQPLTEQTLVTGLGTVIGTPEYMSPEQAEVNQRDIDTRSDIYSLGVLLYEILTGSPPFPRADLENAGILEMLRIIREQEPAKPSTRLSTARSLSVLAANRGTEPDRLMKIVRGELDWIVMRAMEKDRSRRYETAADFATDLRRYLADEPVLACPPSVGYRLRKLARRNKAAFATTAALLLILLAALGTVAGVIGWALRNRTALEEQVAKDRTARRSVLEKEVTRALEDAASSYGRSRLSEALAQVRRAEGLLAGGEATTELQDRVSRWTKAMELALRLEQIPLNRAADSEELDWASMDTDYQEAFQTYGLNLKTLPPQSMATRIRSDVIREHLIAAMDHWWLCKSLGGGTGGSDLLAVIQQTDSDQIRAELRVAFNRKDKDGLTQMAEDLQMDAQQPGTVQLLTEMLISSGQVQGAIKLLESAQQHHPADFWINYKLGYSLSYYSPFRPAEAVGFYRVAVSQRPDNAAVLVALGMALVEDKKLVQAEATFRQALTVAPDSSRANAALGDLLMTQRRWGEARSCFERAVSLDPYNAWPRSGLAWILANSPDSQLHDYPLALAHARKAVELRPGDRQRWKHLGGIQYRAGMWQEAIETLQRAEPLESAPDHYHLIYLVLANWRLGKKHEALRHWVKFVPWVERASSSLSRKEPILHEEIYGLRAEAETLLGDFCNLETSFREILRVEPEAIWAHYALAQWYDRTQQWEAAAKEYRNAVDLGNPTEMATWLSCASSLVHVGDAERYRALCERMEKRFGQSKEPDQIAFLAHVCVLGPSALADEKRVTQLAEQRRAMTREIEAHRLWSIHVLGLALYRTGQFEQSISTLEDGQKDLAANMDLKMCNSLVLAMDFHRTGQTSRAAAELQKARALLAGERRDLARQYLNLQNLFMEAESLLGVR